MDLYPDKIMTPVDFQWMLLFGAFGRGRREYFKIRDFFEDVP